MFLTTIWRALTRQGAPPDDDTLVITVKLADDLKRALCAAVDAWAAAVNAGELSIATIRDLESAFTDKLEVRIMDNLDPREGQA